MLDEVTLNLHTEAQTTHYYAGAQRLAQRTNNADPVWTIGDHLGSTSFTVDSSNAVSELRYKPWGETRYESGVTPTERRYTGQIQDASDLYFYNARYYDPTLGKFLQADTIVPEPGNPQAFNRYSYVMNNPVNYTDPTGHFSPEAIEEYIRGNVCNTADDVGACTSGTLEEWQSDTDWWNMLLHAEDGDVLMVQTDSQGEAGYYRFTGVGGEKLTGLYASDARGNISKGAKAENLYWFRWGFTHRGTVDPWVGFIRWTDYYAPPSFYIRDGYDMVTFYMDPSASMGLDVAFGITGAGLGALIPGGYGVKAFMTATGLFGGFAGPWSGWWKDLHSLNPQDYVVYIGPKGTLPRFSRMSQRNGVYINFVSPQGFPFIWTVRRAPLSHLPNPN